MHNTLGHLPLGRFTAFTADSLGGRNFDKCRTLLARHADVSDLIMLGGLRWVSPCFEKMRQACRPIRYGCD